MFFFKRKYIVLLYTALMMSTGLFCDCFGNKYKDHNPAAAGLIAQQDPQQDTQGVPDDTRLKRWKSALQGGFKQVCNRDIGDNIPLALEDVQGEDGEPNPDKVKNICSKMLSSDLGKVLEEEDWEKKLQNRPEGVINGPEYKIMQEVWEARERLSNVMKEYYEVNYKDYTLFMDNDRINFFTKLVAVIKEFTALILIFGDTGKEFNAAIYKLNTEIDKFNFAIYKFNTENSTNTNDLFLIIVEISKVAIEILKFFDTSNKFDVVRNKFFDTENRFIDANNKYGNKIRNVLVTETCELEAAQNKFITTRNEFIAANNEFINAINVYLQEKINKIVNSFREKREADNIKNTNLLTALREAKEACGEMKTTAALEAEIRARETEMKAWDEVRKVVGANEVQAFDPALSQAFRAEVEAFEQVCKAEDNRKQTMSDFYQASWEETVNKLVDTVIRLFHEGEPTAA